MVGEKRALNPHQYVDFLQRSLFLSSSVGPKRPGSCCGAVSGARKGSRLTAARTLVAVGVAGRVREGVRLILWCHRETGSRLIV